MNHSLNRFIYNIKGIGRMLTPSFLLPKNREKILRNLDSRSDLDYIKKRVDYYCPMSAKITLDSEAKSLDFLRWTRKQTVYFFDCYKYARYFPQNFKAHFEFGAVREYLDSVENLYVCGRNGMHRYNNMDHSMLSAFEVVKCITQGVADKNAIWQVNAEESYIESK